MDRLALGRDIALILLAGQAIVLGGVLFAALFYGLRGARWLTARARPFLFRIRVYVWRAAHLVQSAMAILVAPFVWLRTTLAGLERTLRILGGR